jgi:RNA polymerase sigma factor (sigma-70 family)
MANALFNTVLRQVRRLAETRALADATDAALLERFVADGEEASFAALLQRHGGMVLAVCRGLIRQEQDAEDVFQATFLLLARKAGSVRKAASLGSWLHGVARRLALKARVQGARRQAREQRAASMRNVQTESTANWHDIKATLDEALDRLPDKYRTALILCYLEGKTHEAAARHVGCPLATLRSRIARGRSLLRQRLTKRGLFSSAGFVALLALGGAEAAPAALLQRTLQAALSVRAGGLLGTVASGPVAALVKKGSKMMLAAKLQTATVLLIAASLVAGGTSFVVQHVLAGQQQEQNAVVSAPQEEARTTEPLVAPAARTSPSDRYGDPLPPGARARLGTKRFRLGNGIYAMALSPDGKIAVSVGGNGKTQFWEVPSGKETRAIEGWKQGGGGRVVAYSPDGKLVATVQDHGTLHLWEAASGKHLIELHLGMSFTTCLAFAPDSTVLAAGGASNKYGRTEETHSYSVVGLWKWDGAKLQPLWQAKPDRRAPISGPRSEGIHSLAFSPDGKHLATGGMNNSIIRIWDRGSGKEVRQMKASGGQVGALAFTSRGDILASGSDDGMLTLWDPMTGQKQRESRQRGEVRTLAFRPDGRTLAAGGGPEYT